MGIRIVLLASATMALCACNNDPSGPGEYQFLDFQANSTATYGWSASEEDSTGQTLFETTDTIETKVTSVDDIVGEYTGLTRMEAFSIPHYIGTTQVWYKQYPDSLIEVAYSSAGATPFVLPKRAQASGMSVHALVQEEVSMRVPLVVQWLMREKGIQDSVIERDENRVVYRFPLVVGTSWTSFQAPFLETRQVVGYEVVTVGDRAYWCAKIRTMIPTLDPALEWYDFVSSEGLVKRTLYHPDFVLVTSDDPDGLNVQRVTLRESLILMN